MRDLTSRGLSRPQLTLCTQPPLGSAAPPSGPLRTSPTRTGAQSPARRCLLCPFERANRRSRASPAPAQRAFAPAAGDTLGPAFPSAGSRGISRPLYAGACTCEGPPGRATCGGCGLGAHVGARARWGCCRLPPPSTPCLALQRCGDPLRRPGAGEPGQAPSNCPGGSAHGREKQCFRQRLGAAVPNLCGTGTRARGPCEHLAPEDRRRG